MSGGPGQIKGPTRHQSGDGTAKPAPRLGLDGCCPEPVPLLPPPPPPPLICGCRRLPANPVLPHRAAPAPAAACEPPCKPHPSRRHCFNALAESARPPLGGPASPASRRAPCQRARDARASATAKPCEQARLSARDHACDAPPARIRICEPEHMRGKRLRRPDPL